MRQITLNIGGQDRVFYFGLGFLGNLLEKESVKANEIDIKIAENPFKWMPLIMYYSCAFGYEREGLEPEFTKFHVSDWVDALGMENETIKQFFTSFYLSLTKNVPVNEEPKKKVTKKSTGQKT